MCKRDLMLTVYTTIMWGNHKEDLSYTGLFLFYYLRRVGLERLVNCLDAWEPWSVPAGQQG
jgi:hypothetical protein